MGFWDTVGNVAKKGLENAKDYSDDLKMYRERFENESDEEVYRIYKKSSGVKRNAAMSILGNRGYTVQDLEKGI